MKEKKRKLIPMLLVLLGLLSIIYFVGILLYTGLSQKFTFIWLILGLALWIIAFVFYKTGGFLRNAPGWLRVATLGIIILGIMFFLFVEGLVLSGFIGTPKSQQSYLIVLGAQMKEEGPSNTLQKRLDKAIEYLEEYEETKVIVSGGQGSDEPVSEAKGMYDYLISKGIETDRIIMEDQSYNTHQNLANCKELIPQGANIGIVTSNFHMYRAYAIAKKEGYHNITGIPAPSEDFLMIQNLTREFLAICKDYVVGNI